MARLILCPDSKEMCGNIQSNVTYQYSNGWLTVWANEKVSFKQQLNPERAYIISYTAGKVNFKKMYPPKPKCRVLAWLCGAALEAYCISEEEYEYKIQEYYECTDVPINYEWELKGEHYKMFWTQKKGAHPYSVACYIDFDITRREILELIPTMLKAGFGKRYIQKILNERFEITYNESEKAMNNHN